MFASSSATTYAFSPTAVYKLDPPCGPMSGGSRLAIHGGGFWATDTIVVRFVPPATNKKAVPRGAVGVYKSDPVTRLQEVHAKTPRFGVAGDVAVEVSMNGKDFTANGQMFHYYPDVVVKSVRPMLCGTQAGLQVQIDGSGFYDSGSLMQVRFKGRGGSGKGEVIVKGKYMEEVIGKELDEETEEEVSERGRKRGDRRLLQ